MKNTKQLDPRIEQAKQPAPLFKAGPANKPSPFGGGKPQRNAGPAQRIPPKKPS